jgi:hypothetical protein
MPLSDFSAESHEWIFVHKKPSLISEKTSGQSVHVFQSALQIKESDPAEVLHYAQPPQETRVGCVFLKAWNGAGRYLF